MRAILQIAIGSGLGGGFRFVLDELGRGLDGMGFPFVTFLVNISGSLLIGFLIGRRAGEARTTGFFMEEAFWIPGFCGGFTTFSAFSWQTLDLINRGEAQLAAIYAGLSIMLGVAAVALGIAWARPRSKPNRP